MRGAALHAARVCHTALVRRMIPTALNLPKVFESSLSSFISLGSERLCFAFGHLREGVEPTEVRNITQLGKGGPNAATNQCQGLLINEEEEDMAVSTEMLPSSPLLLWEMPSMATGQHLDIWIYMLCPTRLCIGVLGFFF